MNIPTVNQLFDAGVHFGHQLKRWHPSMAKYIYTAKKGIHIINLEKTQSSLKEASDFLYDISKEGGQVIFVGTKKQSKEIIKNEAQRSGSFYVTERWLGGTMTNLQVIKASIKKLVNFKKDKESGELDKYTKKERLLIDREIAKLEKKVGGLVGLSNTPQALFVVDPKREKTAIKEAKNLGIKVVALIDTNSDVRDIDFPIPGNDDAIKSVALIVKTIADSISEGYKAYSEELKNQPEDKGILSTNKNTKSDNKEGVVAKEKSKTATKDSKASKTSTKVEKKEVKDDSKKSEKSSTKTLESAKIEKDSTKEAKKSLKDTSKASSKESKDKKVTKVENKSTKK